MSQSKSSSTEAVVVKRSNTGETDRLVTLLTRDHGKLICVAKGVRTIKSSKRAFLEPGNYIKCQLIWTRGMPILSQATLIEDCAAIHSQLPKIRQLMQFLEMIDRLFVEEEPETYMFNDLLNIRRQIACEGPTSGDVVRQLGELIENMGYQPLADTNYQSLSEYVSAIADKPMKSWDYLKVKEG